jgi:hypothetical protein
VYTDAVGRDLQFHIGGNKEHNTSNDKTATTVMIVRDVSQRPGPQRP